MFFEDHSRSFEETIGLMHGEEEGNMGAREISEFDGEAVDGFAEIPEASGVMVDQFPQSKEAMPSYEDNRHE